MLNKKGDIQHLREMLLALLVGLVIASIIFLPKLYTAKDNLFGLLGIREKCEDTEKTLNEYKSELNSFFEDPDKFKNEIIKECEELKHCFPEEYGSFKDKCESIKQSTTT